MKVYQLGEEPSTGNKFVQQVHTLLGRFELSTGIRMAGRRCLTTER